MTISPFVYDKIKKLQNRKIHLLVSCSRNDLIISLLKKTKKKNNKGSLGNYISTLLVCHQVVVDCKL